MQGIEFFALEFNCEIECRFGAERMSSPNEGSEGSHEKLPLAVLEIHLSLIYEFSCRNLHDVFNRKYCANVN